MTSRPNPSLPLYQFTTAEYHRLGEAGILAEGRRVELLYGNIIEMGPINSPHAGTVKQLNRLLGKIFGEQAIISVQDPVQLGEHSEPEPDCLPPRPTSRSLYPSPSGWICGYPYLPTGGDDYDQAHRAFEGGRNSNQLAALTCACRGNSL